MSDKQLIDVGRIASLARIDIDAEQEKMLQSDMEKIVAYIKELEELNVDGIEPTAHAVPLHNVWRNDEECSSADLREAILANAPAVVNDDEIKVAQVLPGEGMA